MKKLNIQKFADVAVQPPSNTHINFTGTINYKMFQNYEPPADFHPIKVGEDLSGKEILIIFPKRFLYTLWNSANNDSLEEDFGYKIAINETSFGISANTLFLQPTGIKSYGEVSSTALITTDTGNKINAISASAMKIYASGWDYETDTPITETTGYIMDNEVTLGMRKILPSNFGKVTALASGNYASNIYVKNDNLTIGNKKIEGMRINNKEIIESNLNNKNAGLYKENLQAPYFPQHTNNKWIRINYKTNNIINPADTKLWDYGAATLVSFIEGGNINGFIGQGADITDTRTQMITGVNYVSDRIIGEGSGMASTTTAPIYRAERIGKIDYKYNESTGMNDIVFSNLETLYEYYRFSDLLCFNDKCMTILKGGKIGSAFTQDSLLDYMEVKIDKYRIQEREYTEELLTTNDKAGDRSAIIGHFPYNIESQIWSSRPAEGTESWLFKTTKTMTETNGTDSWEVNYTSGVRASVYASDYDDNWNPTAWNIVISCGDGMMDDYTLFEKPYGGNASSVITNNEIGFLPDWSEISEVKDSKIQNLNTSSSMYQYVKKIVWNDTNN